MKQYVAQFASAREGISKKTNESYYMIDFVISIFEDDAQIAMYNSSIFVNKEQYDLCENFKAGEQLDVIFVPNRAGRLSLLSIDVK